MTTKARFAVGQVIRHRRLGYRGVVADVDPQFEVSPAWYEMLANGGLGQELPFYYVLVDGAGYATYVTEGQLEDDDSGRPISHPHVRRFFNDFRGGSYVCHRRMN